MKKIFFFAAVLALPLFTASSAHAQCASCNGWCCFVPWRVETCFHMRCYGPADGIGTCGQLGPWYLYWPMEAHFQTPAPTGYPFWPSPMTLPPQAGVGAPAPANFMPASFQPTAYGASPPSYWSR